MQIKRGEESIILIGLPGCGKSSYGRRIAKELKLEFADTDEMVEQMEGRSVQEVFEQHGEEYFRNAETEALRKLVDDIDKSGKAYVVAVGGGTVTKAESVKLMRRIGTVVYLNRSVKDIAAGQNLTKNRPLLRNADDLFRLYSERKPYYTSAADITVKLKGSYMSSLRRLKLLAKLVGTRGRMCLIGDPVNHSLSPEMHRIIFEKNDIDSKYVLVQVKQEYLTQVADPIRYGGLSGFNVTAPHKLAFAKMADELRGDAALSSSVNTVVIEREQRETDGKTKARLIGYNTDMEGLRLALARRGYHYKDSRITVLGSGGAAKGIIYKAQAEKAAAYTIVARQPKKNICRDFPEDTNFIVCNLEDGHADKALSAILADTDILINTTPLGMRNKKAAFRCFEFLNHLNDGALVCDLIYNPFETPLLRAARKKMFETMNGLPMLVYQGILSDELVFGISPDREDLYEAVFTSVLEKISKGRK